MLDFYACIEIACRAIACIACKPVLPLPEDAYGHCLHAVIYMPASAASLPGHGLHACLAIVCLAIANMPACLCCHLLHACMALLALALHARLYGLHGEVLLLRPHLARSTGTRRTVM